ELLGVFGNAANVVCSERSCPPWIPKRDRACSSITSSSSSCFLYFGFSTSELTNDRRQYTDSADTQTHFLLCFSSRTFVFSVEADVQRFVRE
ncbi:unnamed protein product, partial [Ixodes pacificus]